MKKIIDSKGIVFYRIPKGTALFRGDSDEYLYNNGIMVLQNIPTFFGLDKENVENNYGITYEFVTEVELKLVALDQKTEFYESLTDEYKQILDKNYGYNTENHIRDSVSKEDKKILDYICGQGYDGYACGQMKTEIGGKFHAEVALCNPADKLSGGKCVTDKKTAEIKFDELKNRNNEPKHEQKKRRYQSPTTDNKSPTTKNSSFGNQSSSVKTSLSFDDDDEYKENLSPNKSGSFGGNKFRYFKKKSYTRVKGKKIKNRRNRYTKKINK
jgi:hypothetical protein